MTLNNEDSWEELCLFAFRILHVSSKDKNTHLSLTQKIKNNVSVYLLPSEVEKNNTKSKTRSVFKVVEKKM